MSASGEGPRTSLGRLGEIVLGTFAGVDQIHAGPWSEEGTNPVQARAHTELGATMIVQVLSEERPTGTFDAVHVFTTDRDTGDILLYAFDVIGFPPDPPARGGYRAGEVVLDRATARGESRTVFAATATGFRWSKHFRASATEPWRPVVIGDLSRATHPQTEEGMTPAAPEIVQPSEAERSPGTFGHGRSMWLARSGRVRNVVRQELIARQLSAHLGDGPLRVLDIGAGQGLQSIRLARAGHTVRAVEPDAVMRKAFTAALAQEDADVQARTFLVPGSIDALQEATGGETFDLVLLLGVLMYLDSSERALAQVAPLVAPGGVLSIATRTSVSALWRPAARQDWAAALDAFEEDHAAAGGGRDVRYVNEIGAPAQAVDMDRLFDTARRHGLALEDWYGVRTAVDMDEEDPPAPQDPGELAALLEVEQRLGSTDPFRQLSQLAHVILRRQALASP